MFNAEKISNAIKYLKECEEELKLPQIPYKDYYKKCVSLLEQDIRFLCFMVLILLNERTKNRK